MGTRTQQIGSSLPDSAVCPVCLTKHALETPHDLDSLFYNCTFYGKFKRWPTWNDASAHCSQQDRMAWLQDLVQRTYPNTADILPAPMPN